MTLIDEALSANFNGSSHVLRTYGLRGVRTEYTCNIALVPVDPRTRTDKRIIIRPEFETQYISLVSVWAARSDTKSI